MKGLTEGLGWQDHRAERASRPQPGPGFPSELLLSAVRLPAFLLLKP